MAPMGGTMRDTAVAPLEEHACRSTAGCEPREHTGTVRGCDADTTAPRRADTEDVSTAARKSRARALERNG